MAPSSHKIGPSFHGVLLESRDALLLIQAVAQGQMEYISRRPSDRERKGLIESGNVFVYCEESSGIKRWTDGAYWSPSRIAGNYLLYRELSGAFPTGKKRAARNARQNPTQGEPDLDYGNELVRRLVGSLIDSYDFKKGGLVKKTFTAKYLNTHYHVVSYYNVEDVLEGRLRSPTEIFSGVRIDFTPFPPNQWRTKLDADGFEIAKEHIAPRTPPMNRTPSPMGHVSHEGIYLQPQASMANTFTHYGHQDHGMGFVDDIQDDVFIAPVPSYWTHLEWEFRTHQHPGPLMWGM